MNFACGGIHRDKPSGAEAGFSLFAADATTKPAEPTELTRTFLLQNHDGLKESVRRPAEPNPEKRDLLLWSFRRLGTR